MEVASRFGVRRLRVVGVTPREDGAGPCRVDFPVNLVRWGTNTAVPLTWELADLLRTKVTVLNRSDLEPERRRVLDEGAVDL